MGDFNIDLLTADTNLQTADFIHNMFTHNMFCSRTAARKRFRLTQTATWPAFDSTVGVDACHCLGVDLSEGRFCIIVTRSQAVLLHLQDCLRTCCNYYTESTFPGIHCDTINTFSTLSLNLSLNCRRRLPKIFDKLECSLKSLNYQFD